jgi:histidinol-phosphate aminotransferase
VLPGNGSDEILAFAFQAFGEAGVSFPDITYGFYPVWAQLYGLRTAVHPVGADFSIDPDDYRGGGLIVLANPNAPTGIALPLEKIVGLVEPTRIGGAVRRRHTWTLARPPPYRCFQVRKLMVVQTFSKSRSLAGARLGFAAAQPPLIADLNRIRCAFNPYNVGTPAQLMGAAAMRDRAYFDKTRTAIMETREWTRAVLGALGFSVLPSSANFLLARLDGADGEALQRALRGRGILVRRFDLPRIRNDLRISVGTPEDMRALINALEGILEGSA